MAWVLTILATGNIAFAFQRPQGNAPAITSTTVRVKLFADESRPPAGILIELDNASGAEVSRNMTDSRGEVDFTNLDLAVYRVRVHQMGYRATMEIVDASSSPSVTVMLNLISDRPKDPSAVPPNGPNDTISANLPASDSGRKSLEKGQEELFQKKDPKAGLPYFDKLVKSDPQYANGWILRGTALMGMARNPEAEESFRKAISIRPDDYASQFALGVSLNAQGKFNDAIAPLKHSLKINADSVEAEYEISRSYLGLNNWQSAEPYTAKALVKAPDFAPLHVLMGNIDLKKRDAHHAEAEFGRYLELAPTGQFAKDAKRVKEKLEQLLAKDLKK